MLFPILYADDLPGAITFYRDLLGMKLAYQYPATGEPEYVTLNLGSSVLGIGSYAPVPGLEARDLRRPEGGRGFELCLQVDDVDSVIARLRSTGVAVLVEPADQVWGERVAYVVDPEGNTVMLAARASD